MSIGMIGAVYMAEEEDDWAAREIALACQSEREASEGTDDWDYGVACYESALRAYRSLMQDGHSGFSIQITKSILNRLIDGKWSDAHRGYGRYLE